jgi:hypothetical protein
MSIGVEATPPLARIAGVVYLLYFLTAVCDEVFVGRGRHFEFAVFDLIAHSFYVAVTLLFYYLFRPVNRNLSLFTAIFGLAGCANDLLGILGLAAHTISSLVFFGPYCLLIGYLILSSIFLPRALGVLMILAGLGWLVVLSRFARQLAPFFTILGFLAEASLMLWLLLKGTGPRSMKSMGPAE